MWDTPLGDLFEVARREPRRKPEAAVEVDWSDPMTDRLAFAVLFDGSLPPRDLVLKGRSVTPTNLRLSADIVGMAVDASASTGRFELSPVVGFSGPDWTISTLVRFPIPNNAAAALACNNSPYAFHVIRNASSNALASWTGSYANFSPTVAPYSLTGWRRVTVVGAPSGVRLHLDGQLVGSHAVAISTGVRFILGDGDGGGLTRAFGAATDFFIWTRGLSDAELRAHALNPYAMLRAQAPTPLRSTKAGGVLYPPFPRFEPNTLLRM